MKRTSNYYINTIQQSLNLEQVIYQIPLYNALWTSFINFHFRTPNQIQIHNCYQPLGKIKTKPTIKNTTQLLNQEISDIEECSDEATYALQPMQPLIQQRQKQKWSESNNQSCEVFWDMCSRKDVKMKSIQKNSGVNQIEDIVISTFDNSSESGFDMLQMFSDLGI
ncbi:Hypothetical_protein [Hexamita inflata]|uniref:Hypothetical_protein n=1 Tax=Hexamita inflata TaxID=28002 RepID=A0ABP1HJM0_9EUKA